VYIDVGEKAEGLAYRTPAMVYSSGEHPPLLSLVGKHAAFPKQSFGPHDSTRIGMTTCVRHLHSAD